jgi:hypothetical protein
MGAEVFHGRVRDGIGCVILAMTTGPPGRTLNRQRMGGCWGRGVLPRWGTLMRRIWLCVGCGAVAPGILVMGGD